MSKALERLNLAGAPSSAAEMLEIEKAVEGTVVLITLEQFAQMKADALMENLLEEYFGRKNFLFGLPPSMV